MRLHRNARRALLGLGALLMSTAAWADPIPGLYNTGLNAAGQRIEPNGVSDAHYYVNGRAAVTYRNPAYYPMDDSQWIGENGDGSYSTPMVDGAATVYYTTSFDLTGLDPTTARITGTWGADNAGAMFINGVRVETPGPGFGWSTAFSITSGFKEGLNTLTFAITDYGPPAAFIVSGISGTASRSMPPTWSAGGWSGWSTTCGSASRSRTVTCINPNTGATLSDSSCQAAQKPTTSETSYQTSGCDYAWTPGPYGSPAPACGSTTMSRTLTCTRSDGQTVANSSCDPATRPATDAPATSYDTCSYSWTADPWSAPSTTCGQSTQTRAVSCLRSDQSKVDDSFCAQAGTKPVTSQSSYQTSGCGHSWKTGEWSGLVAACGPTVENRSVTCERSDGQAVPDASCPSGTRPADQRAGTSYATCGYTWEAGAWSAPSRTCGSSTRTRDVICRRSNGDQVDDASCTGQRPATSETVADFSTCSYQWQYGAYGEPAPACGPSVRTRTATCLRQDGATVDGSFCGAQEELSKPYDDFSACTFQWTSGSWSTPSACGETTRTRSVSCVRQDGAPASDAQCSAGTRPTSTEPVMDTSACTYSWQYGAWTKPASCGPVTMIRTATCVRQDGRTVDDALCVSPRETLEQQTVDYGACTYRWTEGSWSTPSACGQTTRTRMVTCTRSDGATADAGQCDEGSRPATSERITDTSACQYSWVQTAFGGWGACVNGSQSRAVTAECRRSDGTVAADALCQSARPSSESRGCTSPVTPPPTTGPAGGEIIFRRVIDVVRK
jgi:thrombospondin motif-containing protein 9